MAKLYNMLPADAGDTSEGRTAATNTTGRNFDEIPRVSAAADEGTILAVHFSPFLSLQSDHLRTVLAVKGSPRRAQQRRALDRSGPF